MKLCRKCRRYKTEAQFPRGERTRYCRMCIMEDGRRERPVSGAASRVASYTEQLVSEYGEENRAWCAARAAAAYGVGLRPGGAPELSREWQLAAREHFANASINRCVEPESQFVRGCSDRLKAAKSHKGKFTGFKFGKGAS